MDPASFIRTLVQPPVAGWTAFFIAVGILAGVWIGQRRPSAAVAALVVGACAAAAAAVAPVVVPTPGDVFASSLERLLVGCAALIGLAAGWQLARSRLKTVWGTAMIAILQVVCFGVGAAGVYISSPPPGG